MSMVTCIAGEAPNLITKLISSKLVESIVKLVQEVEEGGVWTMDCISKLGPIQTHT